MEDIYFLGGGHVFGDGAIYLGELFVQETGFRKGPEGEDAWVCHFGTEGYPEDFSNCFSRCFNCVYSGHSGAEFLGDHVKVCATQGVVCVIPDAQAFETVGVFKVYPVRCPAI